MAEYDFRSLSPHDFELLCRDLLQLRLGVRLETFSAGRDSGIDLRYRTNSVNLIVQCKHYVESGFDALRGVLEHKERKKLEALKPSRYLLATSVGMTPQRKDVLRDILEPFCLDTADILGREDINNLLTQYEKIERKHFKLWLTSSAVLERVLHAGIFADSDAHLERIRLRLCRYVPNQSFDRAQAILEKTHFCIVAGIPGIGKTTLAEVLLADLVDRQGFTAYRVARDLAELRPVKNPKSKQVFYFDDFLGKTALDKLQKNEDQRLVELMEEVSANPHWRFILTTREYILNIAKRRYEIFAHPPVDLTMCVINLNDYTRPIRAKILYNHIYFSDLPKEHKLALLEDRGYEPILGHRNYNPRVIEYMTQSRHACAVAPTLYRREFLDSLDNPARIWDHAFRHQISEAARHLLLVLATLPDQTSLENLEIGFWKFYEFRQTRFRFQTSSGDWIDGLRELEGNFIRIDKLGESLVVSFHNPSVRDFMEQFLANSESDVFDLLRAVHFYEQYMSLWEGIRGRRYRDIERARGTFLNILAANLWGASARTIRVANQRGETIGLNPYPPSNESRASFFIRVVDEVQTPAAAKLIESVLSSLGELWSRGSADREDLMRLLEILTKRGMTKDDKPFDAARHCLLARGETIEDFRAAAKFCETYPDVVSGVERDSLKSQFEEFASDYARGWDDDADPDWLREIAGALEVIGETFGVNVEEYSQDLGEQADEIERERAKEEAPSDYDDGWEPSGSVVDDVHQMFDGLQRDLKDS